MIKKLIKKYFQTLVFFWGYLKFRIVWIFFNSLIVGLLDGLGLALFIPLLTSVDGGESADHSGMGNLEFIIDFIEDLGIHINLNNVLLIILAIFVLKGFIKFWEKYYNAICRNLFLKKVRFELIDGFTEVKYTHYIKTDSGRVQNMLTTEVTRIVTAFSQYFITAQNLVMVMVYTALAFFSNPQFAFLVATAGIISNFLYKYIYRLTKYWSSRISHEGHVFQRLIIQGVQHYKYLKATNGFSYYKKQLHDKVEKIEWANLQIGKYGAIMIGTREAFTIAILVVVILVQVNLFGGTVGTMVLSLLLFYRALGNLMNVQSAWNGFLSNSGALNEIYAFKDELRINKQEVGSIVLKDKFQSISLKDVTFSYAEKPTLQGINIQLSRNEIVAFVGESGSGKSTLANLITGILDNYQGDIEINGQDLRQINKMSWYSQIGYISQDPVIFDDNIANNITFWKDLNDPGVADKLQDTLSKAALLDFVNELPEGVLSELGTNGVMVSGGQKQRISIARELFKDVSLLVMDEATSALDSETEREIQENIDLLRGQYTMIIIAHRLSTIKNADRIVVLDKGKIESVGSFEELVATNERFKRMVKLQEF